MLSKLRLTTPRLWLCAWVVICISQISHKTVAQGALTLTQPTYNCATGAIVFNTTGGNGSTITYSAAGITRADATSNNGVVEAGLRVDPKPIVITATQNGVSTSFTFNLVGACPGNFALTQPTYNCSTGAITFNTTGGDGSPITYTAPGVSRSSATNNSGTVEAGLRADPKVLVITAVQGGATSVFRFDLAAFCGSNPPPPNRAPVFSGTLIAGTGITGVPFSYTLPNGAFTDPDAGQTLTYTAIGLPTGLSINSATGAITGTTTSTGVNSYTIVATDPGGLSASTVVGATFSQNLAPVFSGTLTSVTVISGAPFSYTLPTGAFTDPNTGQTLGYTATGLPTGLSINAGSGGITGTTSSTGGNSTVVLTATDTGGLSASTTLGIVVVPNVAPVFSGSLASVSATVGTPLNYTLPTGTFTDANTGQALGYTATGLPAGLSINAGTGAITGTPSASGGSSVTITATDPANAAATGAFSISVSPAPTPTFSGSLASATGTVGQTFSYTLPTGTFTTGRGQTLSYAATGLPAGLSINTGTGAITGTPTTAGSSTVTLRATNTGNQSATGTLVITISPVASPTFTGTLVSATGTVGQAFSYTLPTGSFTDPGAQTLTYAATGLPAGLSINTTTGAISGTPTAAGSNTITLRATNTGGQSASGTVGITINTSATSGTGTSGPIFSGSLVSATGTVGQAFSYTLPTGTFTAGANQTLTYAATGLPAGLSINTTTGAISGTPTTAGSSTVTIRATNPGGNSASAVVSITISASTSGGRIATETEGQPISIVAVGGNPIVNGIVEVEVSGVAGEAVQVQLTNMKGEVISQQRRERAQNQERFRFDVSRNPGGTLLLRAATDTRAHTIRLLKVD